MRKWLAFDQHPRRGLVFRSAWVHTVVQLAWAVLLMGREVLYLPLLLANAPGIFYLPIQFPLTGLLLVGAYVWGERRFPYHLPQGRAALALLFFVGSAAVGSWLVIFLSFWIKAGSSAHPGALAATWASFVLTYILPALLMGEIIRQRLLFPKVYTHQTGA